MPQNNNKKIVIVGSGFSGLSAACYLAKEGYNVTILEKNETIGGRARQLITNGFTFDMGPTFYWMPDVFENFFSDFNKKPSDYYELERLNPGTEIFFGTNNSLKISANLEEIYSTFESIEKGSSVFLKRFLKDAEFNYRVAMDKVVYKPGKSIFELIMPATAARSMQFVKNISGVIRKNIKDDRLRQVLEFPVLFLGAKPQKTPAFYCFMNYADMVLGSWHIKGGMYQLVKAMEKLAKSYGVEIRTNTKVSEMLVDNNKVSGVIANGETITADLVISGADYHHTELLLPAKLRNYTASYWQSRIMAPSAILYYVGFNRPVENVSHHTLFFDSDFDTHASNIYDTPEWPAKPMFYTSFPTKTDSSLAPIGKETGIFLIPAAPGLMDTDDLRKKYFDQLIERIEKITGKPIKDAISFYHSYAATDFIRDYNAFKGNAYGLANTLLQTAFLKPKMQNRKLKNLFYTGQLTVPGPGVPPSIISGKIVATLAKKYLS